MRRYHKWYGSRYPQWRAVERADTRVKVLSCVCGVCKKMAKAVWTVFIVCWLVVAIIILIQDFN